MTRGWTGGCPMCFGPEKNGRCVGRCAQNAKERPVGEANQELASPAPSGEIPRGWVALPASGLPRRCKSCGEMIGFAGKVPVNLHGSVKVGGVHYGPSHFTTCPQAEQWRGRDSA